MLEAVEFIEKLWGALVALGAALGLAWRYRKRVLHALGAPRRLWARVSSSLDAIEEVRGEVFRNGGSSLRDAVERCSTGISKLSGLFCLQTDLSGRIAFICDEAGRCTYVSDQWRNLTGLTNEEASGLRWTGALHHEDRARVLASWLATVSEGAVFSDRYRYRNRQTGDVHLVDISASPVFGANGNVVCYYGQGCVVETLHADPDFDLDATFPPLAGGRS